MLVVFDLAGVGNRQLTVVADRIIDLPSRFPAVLRNGLDILKIVPTISRARSDVWFRHELRERHPVRIKITNWNGSGGRAGRAIAAKTVVCVLPLVYCASWHSRITEVPCQLRRGRHIVVDDASGWMLPHVFVACPKE